MLAIDLAENSRLPDFLIRFGIRHLLRKRLQQVRETQTAGLEQAEAQMARRLRDSPLAVDTEAANLQHYEVPAEFFHRVLGPRLKYSCCLYPQSPMTLGQAEEAMLELTCQRAELEDGQRILELGCGWGSLSLWMAEKYRQAKITAVSNSNSQREFIEARALEQGLDNLQVVTADMRDFSIDQRFDRVVSVEMFEHMRNYQLLLQRISQWLGESGKLFVHIFCHRKTTYLFETEGEENWMGRHFFTGGIMPAQDLLPRFQDDLQLEQQWEVNGQHYERTAEAWLANLDQDRGLIEELFAERLTRREAARATQRWRMFFMACAELFKYRQGEEWYVSHYLFGRKA